MKFSKYGKAGLAIIGVSTAIDTMATGGIGTALISLGLSTSVLSSLNETLGDGFGGLLTHQFVKAGGDFRKGENAGLQKNFAKALEKTLEEVRKDFYENEEFRITLKQRLAQKLGGIPSDAAINRGTLERCFFVPLLAAFQEEKTIKEILENNGQLHPSEMVREIVNSKQIALPDFKKDEQQKLIQALSEAFNNRFLIHFNEQLKSNEGAQKAYHTNLLHSLLSYVEKVSVNQERTNKSLEKLLDFAKWQKIKIKEFLSKQAELNEHLDRQRKDFQDIKESFEESRELILDIYTERYDNVHASGQFKYESLYTHFVGRVQELRFFHNFLEEDKTFAWTMLSGPGGSGKSRLANEICVKAEDLNWVAGFTRLDQNKSFSWENFHFPTDMLIVIDYAQARPEEAQHIIDILCTRFNKNTLSKKVRVILLERHFDQNLTDKLFSAHIKSSETYFGDGQHPIRLNKLEEDARWQIILQTNKGKEAEKYVIKNKAEILAQLNKQDPDKRPLFTFFSGVALSEGQNINDWNTHDNLAYHLKRQEDKIWSKSPLWERFSGELRNLIWLASICEYLTFEDLLIIHKETVLIGDFDPKQISDLEYQQLKVLFAANGKSEDPSHMTGIKPDLLAEYYLVTHLVTLQKDERKRGSINQLINICWKIRPERVWWMAYLTYENFQEHNGHVLLLDAIIHLKNTKDTPFFGMLCHNLGFKSHNIDSSKSERYYRLAIENGVAGAMNNLANLYISQERHAEVEEYFLLAIENGVTDAIGNLARFYESQERHAEAEKYYLQAIRNGNVSILANLANSYRNQEKYAEAEKYYLKAVENGDASAMNDLALLYKNQERYVEAEEFFLLAIENGDVSAVYNFALWYKSQERYVEAEEYFLQAIENGDTRAMNHLALLHQNQKRYAKAEEYFIQAIEHRHVGAMNNLANLYRNQGRYAEAEKYYLQAIENGYVGAMNNLALLHKSQERYAKAEEYYLKAIENSYVNALDNLANLYRSQERYAEAEKYYLLAIENGDASAVFNLALLYENQERYAEAEKYYLEGIENGNANSINSLANLYRTQERYVEAEKYYLLSTENGDGGAMNDLAILYRTQERYVEAEKYFLLAIENGIGNARYNLIVLYWFLNRDKRSTINILNIIKPESIQQRFIYLVCNAWLGKSSYIERREEVLKFIMGESLIVFCDIIGRLLYHDHSDELLIWLKSLPQFKSLKTEMGATYYVLLYFCENDSDELKNVDNEIKDDFQQLVRKVQEKRAFYGRSF